MESLNQKVTSQYVQSLFISDWLKMEAEEQRAKCKVMAMDKNRRNFSDS